MKNELIEMDEIQKNEIELDALKTFNEFFEKTNVLNSIKTIITIRLNYIEMFKRLSAEKYFAIERAKLAQSQLVESYEYRIKELKESIENLKRQVK